MKNKVNYNLINILLFVAIFYILVQTYPWWGGLLGTAWHLIIPFLISFVIAYAFHPIVKKIQKKVNNKGLAIVIVVASVLIFIVGICVLTFPLLYDQLISFSKLIGNSITNISDKLHVSFGSFEDTLTSNLNTIVNDVSKYLSDGAIKLLFSSINFLTNTLVIGILTVYFLAYMDKIRASLKGFFSKLSKKTYNYVKEMDRQMSGYFKGLIVIMVIQFFEYSLAFFIIGHPNWLLLGILSSVTTVIPYFGGLIVNIVALIISAAVSLPLFIATAVIALICPTIDGYIISPKVYGKTNNVNPIWIIISVVIGSRIGGIIGIIVSLPLFLLIQGTVKYYKDDIIKHIKKATNL